MIALFYLLAMFALGDAVCRRFFSFTSIPHRLASAFLSGLLFGSIVTYLAALLFSGTARPLFWANAAYIAIAAGFVLMSRRSSGEKPPNGNRDLHSDARRTNGSWKWDAAVLGICLVFTCLLVFSNLNYTDGGFHFSVKSWSDFGPHLSLAQSFALGDNFPTEHPLFAGETIRYHFLFWFQCANLAFLGLNLAAAVNILSILSLMSLLVLIKTFTEVLFNSLAAGRIAAVLFFFASSSLSYIPFLLDQESFGSAITAVWNAKDFLKSGYPFWGENWGALSVNVFAAQRHLISGVGILFVVLVFLVDFYRRKGVFGSTVDEGFATPPSEISNIPPAVPPVPSGSSYSAVEVATFTDDEEKLDDTAEQNEQDRTKAIERPPSNVSRADAAAFIFCGALVGALPYWNSAVFVSAAIVLGSLFALFPYRRYVAYLIGTTIVIGLPQVLMLRSGNLDPAGQSLFHWGYTITDPTVPLVIEYLAWTFGFKWILIFAALWFASAVRRRFFLVLSSLLPVVFLLRLSTDAFNNHKLLNIWIIFATIYAAYAIVVIAKKNALGAALAVFLTIAMILGAVIDLFPIKNDSMITVPHENDRLTVWLFENTQPSDVFLSDHLLSHPITFTGRRLFLGNTYFSWTAGYDVKQREIIYRQMFQERDPAELVRLLQANKIKYVGFDDGVRGNKQIIGSNESVYRQNFEKVFDDAERRYGNLTIYKIPQL